MKIALVLAGILLVQLTAIFLVFLLPWTLAGAAVGSLAICALTWTYAYETHKWVPANSTGNSTILQGIWLPPFLLNVAGILIPYATIDSFPKENFLSVFLMSTCAVLVGLIGGTLIDKL